MYRPSQPSLDQGPPGDPVEPQATMSPGVRVKIASGPIVKAAIFVIGWSMLLIALLESRMLSRVEELQKAHQRDMEELRASSHGLHHDIHGSLKVREPQEDKVHAMRAAAAAAQADLSASAAERRAAWATAAPAPAQQAEPSPTAASASAAVEEATAALPRAEPRVAGPELPPEMAEEQAGMTMHLRSSSGSARPRKLAGFYSVGTTASGVVCYSFTEASATYSASTDSIQMDMNSDNCRGTGAICPGCFIALDDAQNKVLDIIKCSTAKYKAGAAISGTGHIVEIMVMNADPDNTLTVRGCPDHVCSSPASTYTMNYGDSVVGFCYAGGSNKIYFPTQVFQNAPSYDFTGKTIIDLGQVTTVDLNGGTIDGMTINMAGQEIDVSSGTLTLANGQIPATKVTGGLFTVSQSYNFASSTITDTGQITTADINGGTIDGTDITVGSGKQLDVQAGTLSLSAGQILADKISGGTFNPSTYSFAGSTIANLGTVTTANIDGGTLDGVTINNCDYTLGARTLDVTSGTVTFTGGQIQAGVIGTGTFNTGTFSFSGSTISDTGTITTANIDGGTIDGTTVGASSASTGTFSTLRSTGFWYITQGIGGEASTAFDYQSGVIYSSKYDLAVNENYEFSLPCSYMTSLLKPIVATTGPCIDGYPQVIYMSPSTGTWSVRVVNIGTLACNGPFRIFFIIASS